MISLNTIFALTALPVQTSISNVINLKNSVLESEKGIVSHGWFDASEKGFEDFIKIYSQNFSKSNLWQNPSTRLEDIYKNNERKINDTLLEVDSLLRQRSCLAAGLITGVAGAVLGAITGGILTPIAGAVASAVAGESIDCNGNTSETSSSHPVDNPCAGSAPYWCPSDAKPVTTHTSGPCYYAMGSGGCHE